MPEVIVVQNIVDVVAQAWAMEVVDGSNAEIVINGATAATKTVVFAVPTSPWLVNHDLNYVPQAWITDLAGNQMTVELVVTASQITAKPNEPMVGRLHYR